MVTVLYHVTQLRLLGYRRPGVPGNKSLCSDQLPCGVYTTGLSLIHQDVPEEKNPVGRGRQNTVSPPVCPATPRLRREREDSRVYALLWVTSQQMPGIDQEGKRRHVQGQRSPCQEEETAGGGGQASLGNVKMAQSGPSWRLHQCGWRPHPAKETCFCFPSTTPEWIQGDLTLSMCQEGKGHLAQL